MERMDEEIKGSEANFFSANCRMSFFASLETSADKTRLLAFFSIFFTLSLNPGGGGAGGTQIWFRRGCAAEAAKPVPIFKGHFGGKGYPLLRVFSQENGVFVYFSDEKGENI